MLHPAGNIAEALLKEGMAKCVDWSIAKVLLLPLHVLLLLPAFQVTGGPQKYRDAEKGAKERKARIWREYKVGYLLLLVLLLLLCSFSAPFTPAITPSPDANPLPSPSARGKHSL